jgi:hypothetical protein
VGTLLDDFLFIDDDNTVGLRYGRKPVRDGNAGAVFSELA